MQLVALSPTNPNMPESFIEALRQRRIELGLTQLDVAQRIPANNPSGHVHHTALSGWEAGKVTPRPSMLAMWAEVLGVRVVVGLQAIPDDSAPKALGPVGG